MDGGSDLASFITSTLPKLSELEPLLEVLQELGVHDPEDLNYIQESDLHHVLKPVEVRKLLSHFKTTNVMGSPPSNHQSSHTACDSPQRQPDETFTYGSSPLAAEHFILSVDQTIVNSHVTGFSDAIVLLFASYCCLNISYPAAQGATLEFLQRCLFKIKPDKGSKMEKNASRKQLAVSPKVLSLITEIEDYEWRE